MDGSGGEGIAVAPRVWRWWMPCGGHATKAEESENDKAGEDVAADEDVDVVSVADARSVVEDDDASSDDLPYHPGYVYEPVVPAPPPSPPTVPHLLRSGKNCPPALLAPVLAAGVDPLPFSGSDDPIPDLDLLLGPRGDPLPFPYPDALADYLGRPDDPSFHPSDERLPVDGHIGMPIRALLAMAEQEVVDEPRTWRAAMKSPPR
ncbi:hypothetical protein L198_02637 [Cryptococcus wingfieldii CBS 7118]|uniref:Uncharacterized protein n=1 Tax=Cryptococcus wingfieldii CBS 7118 TaxID=1295528 RepID=A0A1E3JM19_9TREE|nr:hypothetical protein L198_02637 [Cryptococcus wingfieldii CBS 7118]ODO01908.1 hypothetical protein L198_02637 [Cryptococcus wingfieldii CBS 7118]